MQWISPLNNYLTLQQLQLRTGGASHRRRPAQQPGPGRHRPGRLVQDGLVVLDDAAVAEAVVPRRDHRAVDPVDRRSVRREVAGIRCRHQHH